MLLQNLALAVRIELTNRATGISPNNNFTVVSGSPLPDSDRNLSGTIRESTAGPLPTSKLAGVDGIEPSDAFSFKEKRAASTLHSNKIYFKTIL